MIPCFIVTMLLCLACIAVTESIPKRIVAVGDLHGDLQQGLAILKEAQIICHEPHFYEEKVKQAAMKWIAYGRPEVIDRESLNRNMLFNKRAELMEGSRADTFHWCGRRARLILLGDSLNVGPDDFDIVYFIMRLTEEAKDAGGSVIYLLGNHELQNLQGNFMGVHPWSFERSGGREGRAFLLSMRTTLGRFLRSRPILHREGSLLFMHGGMIHRSLSELKRTLPDFDNRTFVHSVNRRVRRALEEMRTSQEGVPQESSEDATARFILNFDYASRTGDLSPVLVHPLNKCRGVIRFNHEVGVATQVVGHTPHDPPQFRFCNGSLLAVDFHLSKWKAGNGTAYAALELRRVRNATEMLDDPSERDWNSTLIIPTSDTLHASSGTSQHRSMIPAPSSFADYLLGAIILLLVLDILLRYRNHRLARP